MEGQTLTGICEDPNMPSSRSVWRWLADGARSDGDEELRRFNEQYLFAKSVQAESYVDQMWAIINDESKDYVPYEDKKGRIVMRPNHEHIQRTKLRFDMVKWYASKLAPKIYGEKLSVEHGASGDLADLLNKVSNQTSGLPTPVE